MSGKASVDQLARRFGVQPETIEGWRAEALEGMREAMRRGAGRREREAEMERENRLLRETVTEGATAQALMKANGLVLARDSEPGEPTRGHVAVPQPDRCLAADFTTVWTGVDGVVAVVPTLDCGFRSVLGMVVT